MDIQQITGVLLIGLAAAFIVYSISYLRQQAAAGRLEAVKKAEDKLESLIYAQVFETPEDLLENTFYGQAQKLSESVDNLQQAVLQELSHVILGGKLKQIDVPMPSTDDLFMSDAEWTAHQWLQTEAGQEVARSVFAVSEAFRSHGMTTEEVERAVRGITQEIEERRAAER